MPGGVVGWNCILVHERGFFSAAIVFDRSAGVSGNFGTQRLEL